MGMLVADSLVGGIKHLAGRDFESLRQPPYSSFTRSFLPLLLVSFTRQGLKSASSACSPLRRLLLDFSLHFALFNSRLSAFILSTNFTRHHVYYRSYLIFFSFILLLVTHLVALNMQLSFYFFSFSM